MVFLKYNFIFDASDTWTNLSEFESSLADFFGHHNLEARIMQTIGGQVGDRIMIISNSNKSPEIKKGEEQSKPVMVEEKKMHMMKKGGKPIPKVKDKPRMFSSKKGRKLRETYKAVAKLGGSR